MFKHIKMKHNSQTKSTKNLAEKLNVSKSHWNFHGFYKDGPEQQS